MMKKYLCMAAAALMFAACSNDNENPMESGLARMSFTADIEGMTVTKAGAGGFDPNDKIGIIPVKQGAVEEAQSNLVYTYDSNSKFTGNYYFKDKEVVTFNAYYPIREEINKANPVIRINTNADNQSAEGQAKNDILFATATTTYAKPEISYTGDNKFTHQMSKITLNFKAGAGVDDLSQLSNYTLGSFTLDGSFDLSDGTLSLGDTKGSITMDMTDKTSSELILLPQEVESGSLDISVTYNGMNYTGTLSVKTTNADSKTALLPGTNYVYEVTISNENFKVSEGEIKDWTPEYGSTEVKRPIPIKVDLSKLGEDTYTIDKDGEYILTGSTEQAVLIKANATVTLNEVTIALTNSSEAPIQISGNHTATLILEGSNTLTAKTTGNFAAILPEEGSTVVIDGTETGSLKATGGKNAAGIGGGGRGYDVGIVRILGGTIEAIGVGQATGIGCSYYRNCQGIEILGGTVTAKAGDDKHPAIGSSPISGSESECEYVKLENCTITTDCKGDPVVAKKVTPDVNDFDALEAAGVTLNQVL